MNVHVEYHGPTGQYAVTLFDRTPQGIQEYEVHEDDERVAYFARCDGYTDPSVRIEPTIMLPAEMVNSLVESIKGITPGDALASAVADARDTRDRLLRLVECIVERCADELLLRQQELRRG